MIQVLGSIEDELYSFSTLNFMKTKLTNSLGRHSNGGKQIIGDPFSLTNIYRVSLLKKPLFGYENSQISHGSQT
jgi:hypothetical protein